MTESKPGRKIRRILAILGAAFLLIAVIGIVLWKRYFTYEFPRPPLPKAFPDCPEVPTKEYSWRGMRFRMPADWNVAYDGDPPSDPGTYLIKVHPADSNSSMRIVEGALIGESPVSANKRAAIDAVWSLKPGESLDPAKFEMMGPETIPGSVQKLEISGYKAILYMDRGLGIYGKEHDAWTLLILRGKIVHELGSPSMFNPYVLGDRMEIIYNEKRATRNEELACGYWTILRNLEIAK